MTAMTSRRSSPDVARDQARKATGLRPEYWRVKELVALGICGRSKIHMLLADGTLTKIKVGKNTLIPDASVRALLAKSGN